MIDHNPEKSFLDDGSCCKERCDGTSGVVQSPICMKGFMQVEGLDFIEMFAPNCKPETKRIMLALGSQDELALGALGAQHQRSTVEERLP